MKKQQLPYKVSKRQKGKTYQYFRLVRNGKETHIRLPDNPDSEEYAKAYWAIRSGNSQKKVATSWDALIAEFYASPNYLSKAKGTRENYRRHCEAIREKNGPKDVRTFRRAHAIKSRDALAATWSKANERVAVLSILLRFAADLEWIDRNPIVDVPKLTGGEYEAWPDDKLLAFEGCCDKIGNKIARTIHELCIGTGQRIGDCVGMKWSDFDGEYVKVVQEKTKEPLEIYCPKRLASYLEGLKKQGTHILARNLVAPIGKRAAQKAVEDVRRKIGLLDGDSRLVPHGWRYTAAKQLADAGCSDSEIQAVTGHRTLAMVQKYRAQAGQKAASRRAQKRRER